MDQLRVGDSVLAVMDNNGAMGYEQVFFISHKDSTKQAVYMSISTGTGKKLTATPDHMVYVTKGRRDVTWRSAQLVDLASVRVGDLLWAVEGKEQSTPVADIVVQVAHNVMHGVYHPHTASGTIVVDQVVASCYTKHIQVQSAAFGNALFTPLRLVYQVAGPRIMEKMNDMILSFGIADSPIMIRALAMLSAIKDGSQSATF
jgi:hypothetical protein